MFLILPDIDCECQHTDPEGGAYKEQGCIRAEPRQKSKSNMLNLKGLEIG